MTPHDELISRLRENPADAEAWAVLQDWLLANGDPRGVLATAPPSRSRTATLKKAAKQWFGMDAKVSGDRIEVREDLKESWAPGILLELERGHGRTLRVETRWDGARSGWGQAWMYPALRRLMEQPVAALITDIEVRATPYSEFGYEGLVECLTDHGPLAVRRFYAGDDDQLSWTVVPDVSSLWRAAPWLEEVKLEGSAIGVGTLDHPRLKKLEMVSGGLTRSAVRSVIAGDLPALQHLELWFGDSEYGAENGIDDVLPLLGRAFPALRVMALVNCEFADALVPAVRDAAWLSQLDELRFHDSILTDDGARILIDHHAAFAHLKRLNVEECFLSDAMTAELSRLYGDAFVGHDQNDPYDYGDDEPFYYVGIGE